MKAWLFDVDGVLTNPEEKIANPQILSEIARRLENGDPVALATGRSTDFMRIRVVDPLKELLNNPNQLQNFLAVGEKGGVWMSYSEGKEQENVDPEIYMPQELVKKVKSLIKEEFSDVMFFDETKRTMISTEMNDGADMDKYHERQKALNEKLKEFIKDSQGLELDPSVIATDIQHKHVGKDLAVRHVLEWLRERGIKLSQVIAFGDSKSDIAMAEEVHRQGLPVKMIFVGKPSDIEGMEKPFPVVMTSKLFDKGTLEFLQNYF